MQTQEITTSLAQRWQELKEKEPRLRIRNAAQKLGVSEAELLATTVGTEAIRLKSDWKALLTGLPKLGPVMSLTRNEGCVLEHHGTFEEVKVFGKGDHQMGIVIGPIETRVFLKSWHVAFAVRQEQKDRILVSIQVFDHSGEAITKIYMQPDTDEDAYEQLLEDLRSDDQSTEQSVTPYETPSYEENPDQKAFLEDWGALKDTHGFFPLLKKHNVHRYHAVELAEKKFTYKIPVSSIQTMLEKAAKQQLPIMVFAGNRGNLQIHQDKVRTIKVMDHGGNRWLNVLDPKFNMHLREDLVDSVWVVRKPTTDGDVTALECYDQAGEMIVQFFGLRKPGIAELTEWRDLVADLG
ncbi:MAG: ChuX/HutX family heme-like substrate-binding protein [Bacteroidota bacterium]